MNLSNVARDPWHVLGIPQEATDQEIRGAYLRAVQAYPPDRSPTEFERIRDAYAALRDPRRRAMFRLLAKPANLPLEEYFAAPPEVRPFVGPDPWLKYLRES
jgi:curved DNA-binding protein CbpA